VDDANPLAPAPQRFELRSDVVVRALAIASASALPGAVLVVLWAAQSLTVVVLVLGLLLLVFGVALALAAVLAHRRLRQTVVLTDSGISVRARGRTRTVPWSDVKQVNLQGVQLVLEPTEGKGAPLEVTNPRGSSELAFSELLPQISVRLDANRGYRRFE
jgi:hypothetical protein